MTYQVLARKWRPQDFSSLVGQEPIVTALRNALTQERIAQAYVFSGIRGVGKTTAARVFAKALNCEGGSDPTRPSADPCNECVPCREITAGNDMDVQEIDAATYSKVEQVRELTERLRYGTARDRYKVVVLDEVHRLSRQAFDALLKIVEEPPPHLVFLFATTELDAVPATVLSRCQEFQFRRVPSPVLAPHLRRIADAEEIEVSDASLRMIARAGEGSVRDSVALLDQLATFGGYTIRDEDALALLGGLDAAIFHGLLRGLLAGEPATVLELVREIELNGWDPHNVYSQFLAYSRDALHLALGGDAANVDLPAEEAEALAELVRPAGYENLLRLTQLLLRSEPTVRRSEFGLLALEVAWLRAAELPKLVRIEDLLAGRATVDAAALPAPTRTVEARTPDAPPRKQTARAGTRPEQVPSSQVPSTQAPPPDVGGAGGVDAFRKRFKGPTRQALSHARIEPSGETLRIRCDRLGLKTLEKRTDALEQAAAELWGAGIRVLLEVDHGDARDEAPAAPSAEAKPKAKPPKKAEPKKAEPKKAEPQPEPIPEPSPPPLDAAAADEAKEHPTVQAVLDLFGGRIESIQPKENETS